MTSYGVANQPKIEILERTEDEIRFILKDTTVSMANTLRRIMLAEVPTIAIDVVRVEKNTTVLFDEYIAHRLGFIPIKCSLDALRQMRYKDDCECDEGCPQCSVTFDLNVISAKREGGKKYITSKDLKVDPVHEDKFVPAHFSSETDKLTAGKYDDGIRICRIGPGQHLKLKCIAQKGFGKIHAKWQPVSTAVYQQKPIVKLDKMRLQELDDEQIRKFIDSCPSKVFKYNKSLKERVEINGRDGHMKCVMCDECLTVSDSFKKDDSDNDVVKIDREPRIFYFTVESTGALRPQDILVMAVEVLQNKLKDASDGVRAATASAPGFAYR